MLQSPYFREKILQWTYLFVKKLLRPSFLGAFLWKHVAEAVLLCEHAEEAVFL
jgi:hypothetical protein